MNNISADSSDVDFVHWIQFREISPKSSRLSGLGSGLIWKTTIRARRSTKIHEAK